jgi:predicted Rossmann fold flavoprotein
MKSPREIVKQTYDVIVIGGGASGMMAAGIAAKNGRKVLLIEKNKALGEKLKITGGGRCNITNAEFDIRKLLSHYGDAEPFLYSAFSQFGVQSTFDFFESLNVPIVVQARKRAFPKSESSVDVCRAMVRFVEQHHVTIATGMYVMKVFMKNGAISEIETNHGVISASQYIIATGGLSHPETGSTGDGFNWLKSLGHSVQAPTPTIVPLAVHDEWIKKLSGTSLSFMKIIFYVDGKKSFSKTGKILFTHFGLSGPLILNSSQEVSDLLQEGLVTAKIDTYPDTDIGTLEQKILKVFDANKNKMLKSVMDQIVPLGLVSAISELLPEINQETKVHSVSRDDRKKIVQLLKALPVSISGLMGFDRAVIADGGVSLDEIDTKTMRSKKIKNMLVTGDLLHVNRPSGGYSLQLCWTTGYIAGMNA